MTTPACTRCTNGWFQHPDQGWAVACPNCRPDVDRDVLWVPVDGNPDGRVIRRYQLPPDHPSQQEGPMPNYVRVALAELRARQRTRERVLEADERRSA